MEEKKELSFIDQVAAMPRNFWVACFMEILERLAFFGVRAIAPMYLIASSGENGLGLNYVEKGQIYTIWALLQCLIPMVSGGYSDRYGYRKSLSIAFIINILGYMMMAYSKPLADHFANQGYANSSYWVFMMAACLVATGTAIFKPPAQGTIAKSTDEETSSMGWGIFYWVVNIGGAIAPMGAAMLRLEVRWNYVFYAAAIVTALNFIPAYLLFKEPERKKDASSEGPFAVFATSMLTIAKDRRLVCFLLIFSCFWLMFMQLWDLLPNFVGEWVDTADVAPFFGSIAEDWVTEKGQVKPEIVINIDSLSIIALVIPISWMVRKVNKVGAMILGMIISLVGFLGTGATNIGWLCCLMVFVFAIGEMICSPTFSAYIALIAPSEKKALYMGYSNIPFAIGWAAGNLLSGSLYENYASKFNLARRYLVDHLGMTAEFATDETKLPKDRVMETMARAMELGTGTGIEEQMKGAINTVDWTAVPKAEVSTKLIELFDKTIQLPESLSTLQATQTLWDLHHPYVVWYILGAVGLAGTIGMIVFYYTTRGRKTAIKATAN